MLSLATVFSAKAQSTSTYQQVYSIFQAKCIACHNYGTFAGQLNLDMPPSQMYSNIVGKNPVNPTALARGDKRIDPGYPHRSFLMRKINTGLDADNGIAQPAEGAVMPSPPNPPLSNYEKELIQQWILYGAPQTGLVVDTSLINTFYTVGGINSVPVPLTPPVSNGFQIHVGKIFMKPKSETEIFLKYNPKLADTIEINRIKLAQSIQSHHFVIYKFYPGQANPYPEGFRDTSMSSHGSADILTAFSPQTIDHILPTGTAYRVEKTGVFDLNYHLVNSNQDSVLAAEIYFNIYTQPKGTAQKFMFSRFFPNLGIIIPPGDTSTFTVGAFDVYDSTDTDTKYNWNIWIMYTHTHRYGLDYDVFFRNQNGSMGQQIYEGFYNFEYTFNQGYYAWGVEAPQRHFYPFLEVNPYDGFIHRAVYKNTGTDTAYFGLTSKDEMMVFGFQYTLGNPVSVKENFPDNKSGISIFPNPFTNTATLQITNTDDAKMRNAELKVFDMFGKTVFQDILNIPGGQSGTKNVTLNLNLPAGMYFFKVEDKNYENISIGKLSVVK